MKAKNKEMYKQRGENKIYNIRASCKHAKGTKGKMYNNVGPKTKIGHNSRPSKDRPADKRSKVVEGRLPDQITFHGTGVRRPDAEIRPAAHVLERPPRPRD